jgi:ubiquinone/menaquinone biosynthesis C-methylase UbiE
MMARTVHHTEQAATAAFDKQASLFDRLYNNDLIIQYKRKRVRDHMENYLPAHAKMLELNAGTGEDAIYFAGKGHSVHATDISVSMQQELEAKAGQHGLNHLISTETCSFTELENLQPNGCYDYIFSNFAGLNCTNKLEKVLDSFSYLLNENGYVTLVIMPRFCLWEFLLLFLGKFKTAFRRFAGKKGASAHIEGEYFRCWYYNPSFVSNHLKNSFRKISVEGLCTIVPPSYMENFGEKYPGLFKFLINRENNWKKRWPWRSIGDYYIITLQKK